MIHQLSCGFAIKEGMNGNDTYITFQLRRILSKGHVLRLPGFRQHLAHAVVEVDEHLLDCYRWSVLFGKVHSNIAAQHSTA